MDERASQPLPDAGAAGRFLTFRVAGRLYALPGEDVAEIISVPPVARLPHSPKSLLGLANLRGMVLPMVDLGSLLGWSDFTPTKAARAIVAAGATPFALAVDTVHALVSPDAGQIETRQAELAAEPGERLRGAFQTHTDRYWADGTRTGQTDADPTRAGPTRAGQTHADREHADQTQARQTNADQTPVDHAPRPGMDVAKILDLPALLATEFNDRRPPARASYAVAARDVTEAAAETVTDEQLLLSFEVAGQDYALALEMVREIVPFPPTITIVPRAEAVLLGVAAWRDTLLPLLSLRGLLGFSAAVTISRFAKVIVVPVGGVLVGLAADRVRAVIRASVNQIDAAPSMLAARTGGESKITAIYRGDGGRHLVSVLAPDQLFREDVMRRLGDATAAAEPRSDLAAPIEGDTVPFVVFRLGFEEFALPVSAVDEVARVPSHITRVPGAPKFLEGVVNLRGEVLPVVDQRRRFGLPEFAGGAARRLIVVRTERHRAGLVVDSVSEVLRAPVATIDPPPEFARERGDESARLIDGVINAPASGRMILLLDPAELLTWAERAVLDKLDLDSAAPAADPTAFPDAAPGPGA